MDNYTIFSYVFLAVVGFAAYQYYNKKSTPPVRTPEMRSQPAKKEKAKKPKEKKHVPSAPAPQPAKVQPQVDDSSEDEVDNKEFARQLLKAKTGTKVTGAKKSDEKRVKSVKQSQAQEKAHAPVAEKISTLSSTAGIDADDDQSAEVSPLVKPIDSSGVSDMLETPAPAPGVLRLTDTDKEKSQPKKAAKAPEPVLTKKQRQNKKKTEAAKALRAAEEEDRKAKQEAQRRLARISEGRPAKDGSTFMASQAANAAWKNPESVNEDIAEAIAPLDTFEGQGTKQTSASNPEWIKTLPSEEEQIERARQEAAEDEWSTVETKASKRKQQRKETDVKSEETAAPSRPNGASAKSFASQSSFAALKTGDSTDESEQSDSKTPATRTGAKAPTMKNQLAEVEWDI